MLRRRKLTVLLASVTTVLAVHSHGRASDCVCRCMRRHGPLLTGQTGVAARSTSPPGRRCRRSRSCRWAPGRVNESCTPSTTTTTTSPTTTSTSSSSSSSTSTSSSTSSSSSTTSSTTSSSTTTSTSQTPPKPRAARHVAAAVSHQGGLKPASNRPRRNARASRERRRSRSEAGHAAKQGRADGVQSDASRSRFRVRRRSACRTSSSTVPDPAVPAPDLPGSGDRVRRPVAGAGGDQRDRDRLRPQSQRVARRRSRLDAVPALDLEDLGHRRQRRRSRIPYNPVDAIFAAARYLQAAGASKNIDATRSSPTTTRRGTCSRCCCARS